MEGRHRHYPPDINKDLWSDSQVGCDFVDYNEIYSTSHIIEYISML